MRWSGTVRVVTVTVSPKYQVVIPSEVRERMKLKPGQKLAVVEKDGVVHLVPVRPLKEMRGFTKVSSKGIRDGDEGEER